MDGLETLNLQDNIIETFNDQIWLTQKRLKTLNIGGNKIKGTFTEKLLWNLVELETFIANRNFIEVLPALVFTNNTKLQFINLNNNWFLSIRVDFTKLKMLTKVLGIQNNCTDFFLNSEVNAANMTSFVIQKCNKTAPVITTTATTVVTTPVFDVTTISLAKNPN